MEMKKNRSIGSKDVRVIH